MGASLGACPGNSNGGAPGSVAEPGLPRAGRLPGPRTENQRPERTLFNRA
jgi:hypothetical protein